MTSEQQFLRVGESAARLLLSANEEFMCAFDPGDGFGVFGPRGIILGGWRMHGQLDMTTLRPALNDVVARHEALRTAIIRDKDDVHARVYPPCPVELTVVDLSSAVGEADRERRAHTFLNEVDESARIDATQMPLLCAMLGRFDDEAVLVLVTHHTVSDGWSIQLIMRDVAICYGIRRGLPEPGLSEVRQARPIPLIRGSRRRPRSSRSPASPPPSASRRTLPPRKRRKEHPGPVARDKWVAASITETNEDMIG